MEDFCLLLTLARLGAARESINISSSDIARELKISQQTAARRLKKLDHKKLILRRVMPSGQSIRISDKGLNLLKKVHADLHTISEEMTSVIFKGNVVEGMGEGRYYMEQNNYLRQFEKKLGFRPYPGTLNLKLFELDSLIVKNILETIPNIKILGFKDKGRTFGSVECYPAIINEEINGAIILPARTHYGMDIIELIAPVSLRKYFKLKNGDIVRVECKYGKGQEYER
ncbi:MAG: DUF120 domain-containing protein [Candidatus Hydrothermarchaeota archaeon]